MSNNADQTAAASDGMKSAGAADFFHFEHQPNQCRTLEEVAELVTEVLSDYGIAVTSEEAEAVAESISTMATSLITGAPAWDLDTGNTPADMAVELIMSRDEAAGAEADALHMEILTSQRHAGDALATSSSRRQTLEAYERILQLAASTASATGADT